MIRIVKKHILLIVIIMVQGCFNKALVTSAQDYVISKGKSKDGSIIVAGKCYDFNSKSEIIPCLVNMNGIVLNSNMGEFKYNVWKGDYRVSAGFVGKEWTTSDLVLEKGDSVFVKFYLKDDERALREKLLK